MAAAAVALAAAGLTGAAARARLQLQRAPHERSSLWPVQCAQLDALCFPPHGLWSVAQHEEELCSGRSDVLGAWDGMELVAFSYVSNILDEAHMLSIVVHPDYRGRSLGKALLLASVRSAFLAGQSLCTLEVRRSNKAAIGLYSSCKFQEVGVRRNYYKGPKEDALIMTCYREEHEQEVETVVEESLHAAQIRMLSDGESFEQRLEISV